MFLLYLRQKRIDYSFSCGKARLFSSRHCSIGLRVLVNQDGMPQNEFLKQCYSLAVDGTYFHKVRKCFQAVVYRVPCSHLSGSQRSRTPGSRKKKHGFMQTCCLPLQLLCHVDSPAFARFTWGNLLGAFTTDAGHRISTQLFAKRKLGSLNKKWTFP